MKCKREKSIPDQIVESIIGDNIKILGRRVENMQDSDEILAKMLNAVTTRNGTNKLKYEDVLFVAQNMKFLDDLTALVAVNNWYYGGRQIYRFDEELTSSLLEQTKDDLNVSMEFFQQLPCTDFFVERQDGDSFGFFFTIYESMIVISNVHQGGKLESNLLDISYGSTIKDCMEYAVTKADDMVKDDQKAIDLYKKEGADFAKKLSRVLQFVLYLSTTNADIEPITTGAIVHRTATRKYSNKKTEVSQVGYRIGNAIRQMKSQPRVVYDGEHQKGSPKSPHIRRAHYQTFWTGSGDNKKPVLKWVQQIFVNGKSIDISTIHNVK